MPAFDQSFYQVRFEWGTEGLARLAPADIVIVVDVLRFSSTVVAALDRGETVALDDEAHAISINGAAVARDAADASLVLLGSLRNASAIAAAVDAEQTRRGARTTVAVIAAGELDEPGGSLRFAVEDLFGAGAVISALTDRGHDHCSPEAVAASESFRSLRRAVKHLLNASGSGRELAERGLAADVAAAGELDASAAVPVLRDGVFVADQ